MNAEAVRAHIGLRYLRSEPQSVPMLGKTVSAGRSSQSPKLALM